MGSIFRIATWSVSATRPRWLPNYTLPCFTKYIDTVLYHQPEKMAKSKEDLAERQENLEKLKRQHGIE